MSNTSKITIDSAINLSYLAFLIVWQPIKLLTIQVDGKGRIPFVLTFVVLLFNLLSDKKVRQLMTAKPFIIWFVWLLYAFVNMMIVGYHYSQNTPLFYLVNNLFTPFLALVLTCRECLKNRKRVLKILTCSLALYCVLGFFFMDVVRSDSENMLSLGNLLAINGSFLIYLLCAGRNERIMSGITFIITTLLVLLMIISTATRKAFGVAMILLAFYGISIVGKNSKRTIVVLILALAAYFSVDYMMDHTYLGERFSNPGEFAEENIEFDTDNKFLQFVGDRAPHYIYGWELFKQHPVTGIGLYNFMHYSRYDERLHTDYMVQLTENGIVGIILFAFYYLWYIFNLNKLRKVPGHRGDAIMGFGWIAGLLFLGITAWTYDIVTVFMCSGIVASYIYSNKQDIATYYER